MGGLGGRPEGRLEGKTALVTAAGQGQGKAVALAMARERHFALATTWPITPRATAPTRWCIYIS